MRKMTQFTITALLIAVAQLGSAEAADQKIAVVDFKQCAEDSRLGKNEKEQFEGFQQQAQSTIENKEKELKAMMDKFNDPEYIDSLSPDAEEAAKIQFQQANAEYEQLRNNVYQALNQANYQIIQKLSTNVSEVSTKIAKEQSIDIVLNSESSFYHASDYDITNMVIAQMDKEFEEQQTKEALETLAPPADIENAEE